MPKAQDAWVTTPAGKLFIRTWEPAKNTSIEPSAPIVLFHDSLGCVELWRDFPAMLATAAQRTVMAYDRLGFGRSDARQGPAKLSFIRDEAHSGFPHIVEALKLDKFVAFGHSVGGAMAAHCAQRFASSCEALITESAQAFVEDRTRLQAHAT